MIAACAVWVHIVFARHFGAFRAFGVALLFGVAPASLLSATSLAGEAYYLAPVTAALVTAGDIIADPTHRPWLRFPVLGALLGLCMWGLGVPGLAMPLLVLALFAVASRDEGQPLSMPALAAGAAGLAVTVLWPVLHTWMIGGAAIAAAEEAGTLVAADVSALARWSAGWAMHKDVVGVSVSLGAPLFLLIALAPGSRARALWHPVFTPIAAVVLVATVAPGVMATFIVTAMNSTGAEPNALQANEAWGYLLYHSFLSERAMPDHVTFDLILRMTAFSAYPAVALAPFGFAYLLRTADADTGETVDTTDGARAFKLLLCIWTGVAFGVLGIAATLSRQYTFAIALPVSAAVVLSLTDTAWLRAMARNRTAWYTAGLASVFLLVVLSKDVRGTFDEELGRPGPHVIFEMLLTDGRVEFPSDYALLNIRYWFTGWVLLVAIIFSRPLANLRRITDGLVAYGAAGAERGRIGRLAASLSAKVGRVADRVTAALERAWNVVTRGVSFAAVGMGVFIAAVTMWGAQLAFGDVPAMTHHFSQKGIVDTYHALAREGEALHTAGIPASTNTYYLQSEGITAHPRVADLRELFCDAGDERVFVVLPADDLAQAYYHVRRENSNACDGMNLYVVDGRSSRYLLASNQLHEDRGERQQSFIAENVFSDETLPEDMDRPATHTLVGDDLELVGFRVISDNADAPRTTGSGEVAIEGYFRVLSTPPSGYESFIHVDFGANRINGDHDLVEGRFPMNYWIPGEIVRDRYMIEVSRADRSGDYTVWYGFFRGDDRLVLDPPVGDNRMNFGTLTVQH